MRLTKTKAAICAALYVSNINLTTETFIDEELGETHEITEWGWGLNQGKSMKNYLLFNTFSR
ncbi:hypothetical protein S4054249_24865 [Pseudoalteromonas luteoviolacea]|nr:hypothetical protein S4054249_24865 [Pseudoalteromonas luteoviolacea]AOT15767.1 hypothetical protein S40542_23645 [Pseudoalteromonas luteoviolacea]AOT20890.1 hypothetical protein S4054_24785 [Pseudoalteromonas luteoviolacea]